MKKSQTDDLYDPMTTKEKTIIGLVIASPLILIGGVDLLGEYYKAHPDNPPRPTFKYDYVVPTPDITYKEPKFKSGRDELIPHNKYGSGVTLDLGSVTIETGLTSDEIINQLTIDYQDLYDQYGGSEELY